jgi:hypothetical protein
MFRALLLVRSVYRTGSTVSPKHGARGAALQLLPIACSVLAESLGGLAHNASSFGWSSVRWWRAYLCSSLTLTRARMSSDEHHARSSRGGRSA